MSSDRTPTRKALVIYLMAGHETPALAEAAVAGGADLIEAALSASPVMKPCRGRFSVRTTRRGHHLGSCLLSRARYS
jgi:hypothetical protein